jgi:hypothetical protein
MPTKTGAARLQHEVHQRIVEHGESVDQVEEELIEAVEGLTAEERAGLWLYAWSLQSAAHQRYEALRFLGQLESAEQMD